MKEWIFFGLFLLVGVGMLGSGIVYLRKEKEDPESVKIYRTISIIGAILIIAAFIKKFFF